LFKLIGFKSFDLVLHLRRPRLRSRCLIGLQHSSVLCCSCLQGSGIFSSCLLCPSLFFTFLRNPIRKFNFMWNQINWIRLNWL